MELLKQKTPLLLVCLIPPHHYEVILVLTTTRCTEELAQHSDMTLVLCMMRRHARSLLPTSVLLWRLDNPKLLL